jgi:Tim44-like domain
MKRFWMALIVALTCMTLLSGLAEAKRLGSGGSFGKNRPVPAKQMQRAPESAPQPAPAFSHGGLGDFANNLSMLLMVVAGVGLVLFLIGRMRKPQTAHMQYAGAGAGTAYAPSAFQSDAAFKSGATLQTNVGIPADFPVDSFLRGAKASFIRLQAANDRKDLSDIREYTTPEVFAEISLQLQERGDVQQATEVLNIDAELLEVVNEGAYTIASVRYSGQLRENNGVAEHINEIWHLQKALHPDNAPWLLAGIQQA